MCWLIATFPCGRYPSGAPALAAVSRPGTAHLVVRAKTSVVCKHLAWVARPTTRSDGRCPPVHELACVTAIAAGGRGGLSDEASVEGETTLLGALDCFRRNVERFTDVGRSENGLRGSQSHDDLATNR